MVENCVKPIIDFVDESVERFADRVEEFSVRPNKCRNDYYGKDDKRGDKSTFKSKKNKTSDERHNNHNNKRENFYRQLDSEEQNVSQSVRIHHHEKRLYDELSSRIRQGRVESILHLTSANGKDGW